MKRLHPGGPSFDAIYIYIDTHSAFPLDAWQKIPANPPKPVRDDILDKLHSPQSLASLRVGTRARADLDSGAGRGALQQRKPFLFLTYSPARARHLRPQQITFQLGLGRANTNCCWGGGGSPGLT